MVLEIFNNESVNSTFKYKLEYKFGGFNTWNIVPDITDYKLPTWHRNIEGIFRKHSVKILQYCKNIYKAKLCNVRSKHYKWNIAAILIFHFNIAVM